MSRNLLSVVCVALSRLSSVSLVGCDLPSDVGVAPYVARARDVVDLLRLVSGVGWLLSFDMGLFPDLARVRGVVSLSQLVSGVGWFVSHYAVRICVCAPVLWGDAARDELVSALFRRSGSCAHSVGDASAFVTALRPPYGGVFRACVEYVLWYLLVFSERESM